MPELPEVETVRAGLERFVTDRVLAEVEVRHPRAVRRHLPGAADLAQRLRGRRLQRPRRRGKYLWLPLEHCDTCLVAHLGMSGQLLVQAPDAPDEKHLHVRFRFADGGPELRFVDQRTFGGVLLDTLVGTADLPGDTVPARIAHVARDPLDPAFDDDAFLTRLRSKRTVLKRALLDQTLLSGIGNIYADESLWRARLSGERPPDRLPRRRAGELLACIRAVLSEALVAGGTSFDALYVNVNGGSGYFDRCLAVYGQDGRPCPRCGTAVRRVAFANRSSFYCPRCQRWRR